MVVFNVEWNNNDNAQFLISCYDFDSSNVVLLSSSFYMFVYSVNNLFMTVYLISSSNCWKTKAFIHAIILNTQTTKLQTFFLEEIKSLTIDFKIVNKYF